MKVHAESHQNLHHEIGMAILTDMEDSCIVKEELRPEIDSPHWMAGSARHPKG